MYFFFSSIILTSFLHQNLKQVWSHLTNRLANTNILLPKKELASYCVDDSPNVSPTESLLLTHSIGVNDSYAVVTKHRQGPSGPAVASFSSKSCIDRLVTAVTARELSDDSMFFCLLHGHRQFLRE